MIRIRSSATNSSAAAYAITVTPGEIKEGDLLVAVIHSNLSTNRVTDDNGAQAFTEEYDASTGGAGGQSVSVFSRVATSADVGETSYAFAQSDFDRWGIMLLAIADADILDPWDCNPIDDVNVASSVTPSADSITATTDDLALFFAMMDLSSSTTYSAPTNGFGSEIELSTNNSIVCYSKSVASGAVGVTACTASQNSNWAAFLLLVKERTAGTTDDPDAEPTDAEILALLTASDSIQPSYGLEMLDASDVLIEDISTECISGLVEWDEADTMPDSFSFQITRELAWASVRVRPWMEITDGTTTKRWNLGVYLPVAPDRQLSESPATFSIEASSKLSILRRPIGDAYTVAASVDYLVAVAALITASGMTGAATAFDYSGTKNTTSALAWVLDNTETTYLDAINALLKLAGYERMWVDNEGRFRAAPLMAAATKGSVWSFDLAVTATRIVGDDRTHRVDEYKQTNYWVGIRNGTSALPSDGAGLHIIDNSAGGTKYKRDKHIDADSQTELEAQTVQWVEEETQRKETIEFPVSPLPVMATWGRRPVVDYSDPEIVGVSRAQITGYKIPVTGENCTVTVEVVS